MRKYLVLFMALALAFAPILVGAEDLRSNILPKFVIGPTNVTNNDNAIGAIIDTRDYGSLTYVITTGTLADSDVTLTPVIHGCVIDNCDNPVLMTNAQFVGTLAAATFAATGDNAVKSIGVNPQYYRYNRITLVPAANTGSADFSAVGILGHPKVGAAQ